MSDRDGHAKLTLRVYWAVVIVMIVLCMFGDGHSPPPGIAIAALGAIAWISAAFPPSVEFREEWRQETGVEKAERDEANRDTKRTVAIASKAVVVFAIGLCALEFRATAIDRAASEDKVAQQIRSELYSSNSISALRASLSESLSAESERRQEYLFGVDGILRNWVELQADLIDYHAGLFATMPIGNINDADYKDRLQHWLDKQIPIGLTAFQGRIRLVEIQARHLKLSISKKDTDLLENPDVALARFGISDLLQEAIARDPKLARTIGVLKQPIPTATNLLPSPSPQVPSPMP